MFEELTRSIFRRIKLFYLKLTSRSIFWPQYEDKFYTFHQDNFRGTDKAIESRQKIYLKYLKKIPQKTRNKYPLLDCGFGRGEFLNLIKKNSMGHCIGIDTNKQFVSEASKKGLEVYKQDLVSYLYLTDKEFSCISAFHIIEHIGFEQLFDFLVISYNKLAKGGILILETPNVENIIVSSTTFYYDHTHIQKIPRAMLLNLLKFVGFSKIEVLPLHPQKKSPKNQVQNLLYGSQDLGIVAYK